MLSYEYLNDAVELSNSKIPVLVIENKKIFRQALRSFLDDTVDTSSHDLPQLLISYIILLNKYLKFDLFVLHSLYDFFDNNELEGIYETLSLSHINILILSSSKPRHISKFEEIHILDPDLCIIDSDNN